MAEETLLETLKIVEMEDCVYSATAKRLIGHFNEMINSFDAQKFWDSLNVREEKSKTQTAQVILQEKEEQNACQVRIGALDANIQKLTRKRQGEELPSTPPNK
ncbi:4683_t:CDS:2, partial [Funneliformis caledonium]